MSSADDAIWLAAVRTGHPPGPFGHREHLRVAWIALDRCVDLEAAQSLVSDTVRAIAHAQGVPQRYNRTVTDAWVRIVAHCRSTAPAASFDDVLATHPWLLDKRILGRHYTSRTLASGQARRHLVEPDVAPIP